MPFTLGTTELIIIGLIVLLLILMPSKLPQFAKSVGQAIREFKRAARETTESVEREVAEVKKEVEETGKLMKEEVETIKKVAEKLGVETEGKSEKDVVKEIVDKLKEERKP